MAETLKSLNVKRGAVKRQLNAFFSYVRDIEDESSQLRERFQRAPELWKKFEDLNLEIECLLDGKEVGVLEEHTNTFEEFENNYYSAMQRARNKLEPAPVPCTSQEQVRNGEQTMKIKLPPLTIQPFSGKYEHWLSFKDAFTKAVHDQESLPAVQKFQILKGLLTEDALKVISAMEATDANYIEAWNLLQNRYANARLIINTHIKGLFEVPAISKANHINLRSLVDAVRTHTRSLKSLKQPVDEWSTVLIYMITSKLDYVTKEEWEKVVSTRDDKEDDLPTLEEFLNFLEKRCIMYEMVDRARTRTDVIPMTNTVKKEKRVALATTASTQAASTACVVCNEPHRIYQCEKFLKFTADERYEEVRKHKLCLNCLKTGHRYKDCKSSGCRNCGRRHNTLLHKNQGSANSSGAVIPSARQPTNQVAEKPQLAGHCAQKQTSSVILSTARIYIENVYGNQIECRALLDPGSQVNIITEDFAKRLKLKSKPNNIPITAVDQTPLNMNKSVNVSLKSRVSSFSTQQECLLASKITERIPQVSIDMNTLFTPDGIELADPNFRTPGPIDILIGAGLYWKLIIPEENISKQGQPSFQKTQLGWIVGGELHVPNEATRASCNLLVTTTLYDQIEKFWKIEGIDKKQDAQEEEEFCEKHFQQTHKREAGGRFKVELPQNPDIILGDSYQEAFKRLRCLERRFQKHPDLKERYCKFLAEYEAAGHMSERQGNIENNKNYYYMPHQPVIKDSSLTTKLRVVFDASARTDLGTSLNDRLMPGPNLQNDIFDILLRFRTYEYVFTADIAQMFRQVQVAEKDRTLQQILWRTNSEDPVRVYTLNTVTYGTSCAPFLAMRCLREIAYQSEKSRPRAAAVLRNDFYMDDLLSGTQTLEEAIILQKQLTEMLEKGKFNLRKWKANDARILQHLENNSENDNFFILERGESTKTLGLLWNCKDDTLQYNLELTENDTTKRKILSTIARIYDPLGMIGPVIVTAKMIMQELWKLKIGWDARVPVELETIWKKYLNSLNPLSELRIQRNANLGNKSSEIILHGFCDASEKAYGACVYSASVGEDNKLQFNLLCSKSRVTPLKKTVTLPRLELCAASELAKLISAINNALKQNIKETHLWSDSTITLHWINHPPSKKIFEANRVREIKEFSANCTWHHVPTKDNPADFISRGVPTQKLLSLNLWWHGPQWLPTPENWPSQIISSEETIENNEDYVDERIVAVAMQSVQSALLRKFSRFLKLQRVVAYCIRFAHNVRLDKTKKTRWQGELSLEELELARKRIIKWVQEEAFPREIVCIKSGKSIEKNSALLTLNPFIDRDGIVRVGGRLRNAAIPEEQKHPAILPSHHHVTHIIMRDEHRALKHCGPHQLLYSIRNKYWPLSGGREAREVTRKCIPCFKYKPKTPEVIMGDLPEPRVNVSIRPFETTGVDYAGPLMIRESKRRGRVHESKAYISVFTCFSSKAVHLELVTDLTTEAFLATMRRFVARRGLCTSFYSDNATTFVGADRQLQELFEFLKKKEIEIKSGLATRGITWTFIPPRSPHFGGLWESAVKSVKKHLHTTTAGLRYTFEEYYTLLTEIEAILNSRPLIPMSSDPNDLTALTPSHFLIGSSLLEPASGDFLNVADNRLSRWQHLQKLKQHFWKRWQMEYLQHLQGRSKWKTGKDKIEIGTMVLLVDDNQPPLYWNLGRIEKIIPGADGIIRVADVKTAQGTFRRGIKKLCMLPFDN